jgi:hypothetical protein
VTHLPFVVWLQMTVVPFGWPAWLKLILVSGATIGLLLGVYHWGVRSTWIGVFLNGKRFSRKKTSEVSNKELAERAS